MLSSTNPPPWVIREINTGLMKLLTLSLDGQPAHDVLAGTLKVWTEALCADRLWDEDRDVSRFRKAFRTLMTTCDRWPTPKKFLDAMPSIVVPFQRRHRLDDEKRRAEGMEHLRDIARRNGFPVPGDDEPEPPRAA